MSPLLEICIDTFASAVAAIRGGADRLELCAALSEGGLTPSVGLLVEIRNFVRENCPNSLVQLFVMVRCRRGSDFCYSEADMNIMLRDMALLAENGADGFVFGALKDSGEIHTEYCSRIVMEATKYRKPVSFHRAFDCTDPSKMLDNLVIIESLGFSTLLTSGFKCTAMAGMENLIEMMKFVTNKANTERSQLTIMPGSGVSPDNVEEIVRKTKCKAIHASARSLKNSPCNQNLLSMGSTAVDGGELLVCDETKVREIKIRSKIVS